MRKGEIDMATTSHKTAGKIKPVSNENGFIIEVPDSSVIIIVTKPNADMPHIRCAKPSISDDIIVHRSRVSMAEGLVPSKKSESDDGSFDGFCIKR